MNNPTLEAGNFSSEINAYNLFMQAPALICILDGRAGKCMLSNPGFTKLFGGRDLLGRTPREVAPELEGQGYFEMLESVYETGQPVYRNEYPGHADWEDNGQPYLKYFNLVYTPYRSNDRITGVMIFGIDVTAQVIARQSEHRRLEEEVMKRTAELQKVANDLAISNKDLEQFAAIASHDLKAPLRKITTYVSAISAKQKEVSSEVQPYLDKIERAATDMNALVNNLLEYSKVTAGHISFIPVDLNKIVQQSITELEVHLSESKGKITIEDNLPVIQGEPLQLKRLFTNLLSNSIKFKRKDIPPVVSIQCEKTGRDLAHKNGLDNSRDHYAISITDNGIGFKKEYSAKIFELFTRLNPGKLFEGTGLGLSICKRITDNHEGKIIASPGKTQGAVFTIFLPEK